jgi:hypothetical protein
MCKNLAQSEQMHEHIVTKCATMNEAIFSPEVLCNWQRWLASEQKLWSDTETYIADLSVFVWPAPWKTRADTFELAPVRPSEATQYCEGVQIITHDSGNWGSFSKSDKQTIQREHNLNKHLLLTSEVQAGKACIYKWEDTEEPHGEYVWLAMVVAVEGDPKSGDCELIVRWCPNTKQRTWRAKITEMDTFDLNYSTRLRNAPYRCKIEKKNCLALNLSLNASGKLDNRPGLNMEQHQEMLPKVHLKIFMHFLDHTPCAFLTDLGGGPSINVIILSLFPVSNHCAPLSYSPLVQA